MSNLGFNSLFNKTFYGFSNMVNYRNNEFVLALALFN